jgi:hypothetical protein
VTLSEKVELLAQQANEVAFGYNDSGCFWTFHWGPRGTGSMLPGFGQSHPALEADTFEEAVDEFLKHLGLPTQ